jgi:hypothetical protein
MNKKYFFIGGILLLTLIAFLGLFLFNKPHEDTAGETADFNLSALDLYNSFQKDEPAANKKFLGKVIEVKGVVSVIQTEKANTDILLEASSSAGINCSFLNKGNTLLQTPKRGDTITVKGRCTGYLMDVNLVDCVLKE